jgi:MFS family permease
LFFLSPTISNEKGKSMEKEASNKSKDEKKKQKEARELAYWQKQKARPKGHFYLWYLMFILALVYIVDEVATNLNSSIQPYMIEEFFEKQQGLSENDAQSAWQGYGTIALGIQLLTLFYRTLADRFGRKVFLVFNTFCLSLGMLVCFWSPYFPIYLVGFVLLAFMIGPDMQVVYITESAPKEHRAAFVSVIKGISQLGIALIALGMDAFMKNNDAKWRWVFLIPACLGFIVSLLALFFTRETDQFIEQRIAYLSQTDEEKAEISANKTRKNASAQGGVVAVVRFAFSHYQLKWLFIASMLYTTAFYGTGYYGQIISNAGFSAAQYSKVALIWPFICSFVTIVYGLLSDKLGRKTVSTVLGSLTIVGIGFMSLGLTLGWNEYLVGCFLGLFLAGYWNWGDTLILMVSESTPTNMRSSATGDQGMFAAVGYLVGFLTVLLYTKFCSKEALAYVDYVFLGLAIPGVIGAILVVSLKARETKGIDLDNVRGDEWDIQTKA